MVIKRNPKTGKYYVAPSPPSFYKSKPKSSGNKMSIAKPGTKEYKTFKPSKKTVPHGFIGPLRPGTVRAPAPISIAKPGTKEYKTFKIKKEITPRVIDLDKVISPRQQPKRIIGPMPRPREVGMERAPFGRKIKTKKFDSLEEMHEAGIQTLSKMPLPKERRGAEKIKAPALEFANVVVGGLIGLKQLPGSIATLVKNPKNIIDVPGNLYTSFKKSGGEIIELAKVDKTRAVARIGGEVFLFWTGGKGIKMIGKVGSSTTKIINPKFKQLGKSGKIKIDVPEEIFKVRGKRRFLKTRIQKPSIKRPVTSLIDIAKKRKPGQFKKFQKDKGITLKKAGSVKSIQETLKQQTQLAGKRVTAVSVQAQKLIGVVKRRRMIRKPIPGELTFTSRTKRLLKKFDDNKITSKEFTQLNNRIIKETGKQGSLVERTFFADPRGRFRPSRMAGLQREATIKDIIKGDFTLKKAKPQILVFKDIKIASFPKSLSKVAQKLKSNKQLTTLETEQLLKFQLKKSGKFKPIGHITKEPELVLASGEIIKRVKTVAVTEVKGVKVPIVQAKVVQATVKTKELLRKEAKGTLTKKEFRTLVKRLKKETGFKPQIIKGEIKPKIKRRLVKPIRKRRLIKRRPPVRPKPILKIRRLIPKKLPSPKLRQIKRQATKRRKIKKRKRLIRRPVSRRPPVRPPARPPTRIRPPVRPPRRPTKYPPVRPPRRPPARPPTRIRPPVKPPVRPKIITRKKRKPSKKKIKIRAYDVYAKPIKTLKGKKTRKLIKISKAPLSKDRARDLRNYITDTSLSRTAKIKRTIGKVGKPKLKVPRGYAKKTSFKFRKYRIIKGKRKPLEKGKVIERRKRLLDTKLEKRGITLRKRIKQITIRPMRKVRKKRK